MSESAGGEAAHAPRDTAAEQTSSTPVARPDQQAFWVNTVSLDHVRMGRDGGFVQADHGADTRLRRLQRGDWLVFYSPREQMRAGAPVQAFTALGQVADDEPFRVRMSPDFEPWRRRLDYLACRPVSVRDLLPRLEFVLDKVRWGYPFRRGLFRIGEADFTRIATAMGAGRYTPDPPNDQTA